MNCTYEGPDQSGAGQLRIIAVLASSAEAAASAKRLKDRLAKRGHHSAELGEIDSQGKVVFSIALFLPDATGKSKAQLQQLMAAAKAQLAK